jgi:hypothetical protein
MDEKKTTIELVCQYLAAMQCPYRLDGDGQIETVFTGRNAIFPLKVALYGEQLRKLAVTLQLPLVVPEAKRLLMAEAVVRANYGSDVGRFDLDLGDGRLHCLATMPVADGDVTEEQFKALFVWAVLMADSYFRAFARLLYADDLSPAEVIAEVEMAK